MMKDESEAQSVEPCFDRCAQRHPANRTNSGSHQNHEKAQKGVERAHHGAAVLIVK